MLAQVKRYAPVAISLFAAAVFLDSLRFKFTDHPNTQEIFGRLDGWAGSLGAPGLFGHTGLFSQYVIGSAELAASALLLVGAPPPLRAAQCAGRADRALRDDGRGELSPVHPARRRSQQ